MQIDLHIHTTTSTCSRFSPQDLVALARERNVGAVVTTNHHNSYGDAAFLREELSRHGILYFPGIEITNNWGDFLIFAEDLDEFQTRRSNFPTGMLPRPDIAVIWAHPYRFMSDREIDAIKWDVEQYIDAVEVINGNCILQCAEANDKAARLARELNKPAVAGSDSHSRHMFFMTWTDFNEPVTSYKEFIQCIKRGNLGIP